MTRGPASFCCWRLIVRPSGGGRRRFVLCRRAARKPCFVAGDAAYRLSADSANRQPTPSASTTTRRAPTCACSWSTMPAAADFVLVDDGDTAEACSDATRSRRIRVDAAASDRRAIPI